MSARRETIGVEAAPARRVAVTAQETLLGDAPRIPGKRGIAGTTSVCCSATTSAARDAAATSGVPWATGATGSASCVGVAACAIRPPVRCEFGTGNQRREPRAARVQVSDTQRARRSTIRFPIAVREAEDTRRYAAQVQQSRPRRVRRVIDTVDRRLLTLLDADPTSPFAVLAQQLDVSERTVSRRYHSLHARGLIRVVGRTLPGFGSKVASRPGAKHTVTDRAPGRTRGHRRGRHPSSGPAGVPVRRRHQRPEHPRRERRDRVGTGPGGARRHPSHGGRAPGRDAHHGPRVQAPRSAVHAGLSLDRPGNDAGWTPVDSARTRGSGWSD